MKNILITFVGTNDANRLIGKDDDGAILTILNNYEIDELYLIYNESGRVKEFTYREVAEFIEKEYHKLSHEANICKIKSFGAIDPTSHEEIYSNLKNYLRKDFDKQFFKENNVFANITSGTPAMHAIWFLIAESGEFDIKLIKSIEKQHAKDGQRVIDVPLFSGIKSKMEAISNLAIKETNYNVVADSKHISDTVKKIAQSDNKILITGETGTGKEELFKTLWENSARKDKKYIALNCAGLESTLLESELFGHEKGAFTGAINNKIGIVDEYSEGTLFLDEVNSLNLLTQAKLLRFLESGEYRKLGGNKSKKSEIRIIAATNVNLEKLVNQKQFREDLFYRLREFELFIPPLRERKDDIQFFVDKLKGDLIFDEPSINLLKNHQYKGNIRELKLILTRLQLLSKENKVNEKLTKQVLEDLNSDHKQREITIPEELNGKLMDLVKDMLYNLTLEKSKGNKSKAAEILGVSHTNMNNFVKEKNKGD